MSIFKKENGTLVEYTNPIANNCIAPVEDGGTSAHAYAEGAFVMVRNILKKITSAVSIGDAIDNTNSQDTTVATELADIEGDIEQINSDLSDIAKVVTLGTLSSVNAVQTFTVTEDSQHYAIVGYIIDNGAGTVVQYILNTNFAEIGFENNTITVARQGAALYANQTISAVLLKVA
jgi:hypothetical protein